jgi:hypothetical protein
MIAFYVGLNLLEFRKYIEPIKRNMCSVVKVSSSNGVSGKKKEAVRGNMMQLIIYNELT